MYKILPFINIPESAKIANELTYIQLQKLVMLFDNIDDVHVLSIYNQYTTLVKSGILGEFVKNLDQHPSFKMKKIASFVKYNMLEDKVGTLHQYNLLEKEMDDATDGNPEDNMAAIAFYQNMAKVVDAGKTHLVNLDVVKAVKSILEKHYNPIISDVLYFIKLPYLSVAYDRFIEKVIAPYSVGSIIVNSDKGTLKDYWNILQLILYMTIYCLSDSDTELFAENADEDRFNTISMNYEKLPDVDIDISKITNGYIDLSYKRGEFENIYSGTVGLLNKIYNDMKGVASNYDDYELRTPNTLDEPMPNIVNVKEALRLLINHYNEVYGIVSEFYRCVYEIVRFNVDKPDMAKPINDGNAETHDTYINLYKNISDLCIYAVIVRMTISLIYTRFDKKG